MTGHNENTVCTLVLPVQHAVFSCAFVLNQLSVPSPHQRVGGERMSRITPLSEILFLRSERRGLINAHVHHE